MASIPTAEIRQRARAYFEEKLSQSLEHAFLLPRDPTLDMEAEIAYLQKYRSDLQFGIAKQQFSPNVQSDALALLNPHSSNEKTKVSGDFQYACNAIARY